MSMVKVNFPIEPRTVLVWLTPVTADEVSYIRTNGWQSFESRPDAEGTDAYDALGR